MAAERPAKLIVVMAFDRNEDGELVTVFGPQDFPTEDRAIRAAEAMAGYNVGVIAWSRDADTDIGEYGEPTILFQSGAVPDME